jgi:hypothetical protein
MIIQYLCDISREECERFRSLSIYLTSYMLIVDMIPIILKIHSIKSSLYKNVKFSYYISHSNWLRNSWMNCVVIWITFICFSYRLPIVHKCNDWEELLLFIKVFHRKIWSFSFFTNQWLIKLLFVHHSRIYQRTLNMWFKILLKMEMGLYLRFYFIWMMIKLIFSPCWYIRISQTF